MRRLINLEYGDESQVIHLSYYAIKAFIEHCDLPYKEDLSHANAALKIRDILKEVPVKTWNFLKKEAESHYEFYDSPNPDDVPDYYTCLVVGLHAWIFSVIIKDNMIRLIQIHKHKVQ